MILDIPKDFFNEYKAAKLLNLCNVEAIRFKQLEVIKKAMLLALFSVSILPYFFAVQF
jgi:hypothetical protein